MSMNKCKIHLLSINITFGITKTKLTLCLLILSFIYSEFAIISTDPFLDWRGMRSCQIIADVAVGYPGVDVKF